MGPVQIICQFAGYILKYIFLIGNCSMFDWSILFLRLHLTITQHSVRLWIGVREVTSAYLLTQICDAILGLNGFRNIFRQNCNYIIETNFKTIALIKTFGFRKKSHWLLFSGQLNTDMCNGLILEIYKHDINHAIPQKLTVARLCIHVRSNFWHLVTEEIGCQYHTTHRHGVQFGGIYTWIFCRWRYVNMKNVIDLWTKQLHLNILVMIDQKT